MSRFKMIFWRILILLIAVTLPAGGAVMWVGQPAAYDIATLNNWAPIKETGPSARLLAQGVTRLAGPARSNPPDWFGKEDQELLDKGKIALQAGKLQAGLGHLMVLSSHLEERGKTLNDFLPLVAPDIASWLVASYFAPLLLGVLVVTLAVLIFLPWLVRRLIDALKVLVGLILALAAAGLAISVGLSLSGERALVFTLIEYLAAVVMIIILGNMILFTRSRRKPKPAPATGLPYPVRRDKGAATVLPLAAQRPAPALLGPLHNSAAHLDAGRDDQTVVERVTTNHPGGFPVPERS
ncbi:MAG: hypothetical protein WCF85_00945 [Rhodospirillaceae bacterium]